ncbi:MAG: flagellar biosynthetic protein FliO [Terriglobales bacterium]
MESTRPELARLSTLSAQTERASSPLRSAHGDRVRACLGAWFQSLWRSVASRAKGKPKMLFVRETAALGDRRFVSVIQFESRRFLIGSSAASVTLLAQLPDDSPTGPATRACETTGDF